MTASLRGALSDSDKSVLLAFLELPFSTVPKTLTVRFTVAAKAALDSLGASYPYSQVLKDPTVPPRAKRLWVSRRQRTLDTRASGVRSCACLT